MIFVALLAAALAPAVFEAGDRDAAGNALLAVFTMWTVCVTAAASIPQFDELAIQRHIHLHARIRHKIRCHALGQITAFVFGREIQIEVL